MGSLMQPDILNILEMLHQPNKTTQMSPTNKAETELQSQACVTLHASWAALLTVK